jgi:hypothetical protein
MKELWNIPVKMYYLLVNGVHESLVNSWQPVSSVIVKIKGLGRKPTALTILVEEEEIRCKTNQTLLDIPEDRELSVEGECLFPREGLRVELNEKTGAYFTPGSETVLRWSWDADFPEDWEEEEEDDPDYDPDNPYKNSAEFIYSGLKESGEMIVDPNQSLMTWAHNHLDEWEEFRTIHKEKLDLRTLIKDLMDEERKVYVVIWTTEEIDQELEEKWEEERDQDYDEHDQD